MPNPIVAQVMQRALAAMKPTLAELKQPGQIGGGAANYLAAMQGQGLEQRLRTASAMPVPVASDLAGVAADAMMFKREPEERTLGNFALSGLGLLPLIPAMTAYHASPHKFDKFELSDRTIGTGEGAQAYGHGLYFAEDPKISGKGGHYYNTLAGANFKIGDEMIKKTATPFGSTVDNEVWYALNRTGGDIDEAIGLLQDMNKGRGSNEWVEGALGYLRRMKRLGHNNAEHAAYAYTVDIPDSAIEKMLDWDKPLSEQPEAVRKAFEQIGAELNIPSNMYNRMEPAGFLYGALSEAAGGQENASKLLRHYGIPGIRYLDGNSRGYTVNLTYKGKPYDSVGKQGTHKFSTLEQAKAYADEQIAKGFGATVGTEGTRNFVVFDDSILSILNRE